MESRESLKREGKDYLSFVIGHLSFVDLYQKPARERGRDC